MTSATTPRDATRVERCIASGPGRAARIGLGAGLIGIGLAVAPKPLDYVVALFGLVPIATGVFNLCPVAPLWGGSFFGANYCRPCQSHGTNTNGASSAVNSVT